LGSVVEFSTGACNVVEAAGGLLMAVVLLVAGNGCDTGGNCGGGVSTLPFALVAALLLVTAAGSAAVLSTAAVLAADSLLLTWFWLSLLLLAAAGLAAGCLAAVAAVAAVEFCLAEPGGHSGETVGSGMGRVGGIAVRDRPVEETIKLKSDAEKIDNKNARYGILLKWGFTVPVNILKDSSGRILYRFRYMI
jgi:hypothetical protein